jgi:hypothetical protein
MIDVRKTSKRTVDTEVYCAREIGQFATLWMTGKHRHTDKSVMFPLNIAARMVWGDRRSARGRAQLLAASRRLECGDVDFIHFHHRVERALCFIAPSSERIRQHARRDLPRNSPLVFTPPALALLAAITDDCVPVAVRLFLIFRRDLEREGFVVLEYGTAVEP